jgi:hypothetical protein
VATSATGFLQHAGGTARVVELAGPGSFAEYPQHGYFLLARPLIIGHATMHRQPTFLDRPEWMSLPWSKHPETRNATQRLYDINARMPRLFADVTHGRELGLISHPEKCTHFKNAIYTRLYAITQDLVAWRRIWDQSNPGVAYEYSPEPGEESWSFDVSGVSIYPRLIAFVSLESAVQYTEWTKRLQHCLLQATSLGFGHILSAVTAPSDLSSTPGSFSQRLPEAPYAAHKPYVLIPIHQAPTLAQLGDEYARTIGYFLRPEHRLQGAFTVLSGVRSLLINFMHHRDSRKVQMIRKVMETCLSGRVGLALSPLLGSRTIPGTGKTHEALLPLTKDDKQKSLPDIH